ncbi:MAG: rRNA pseudouridine synthase [Synergistetes bacterium]|nr:rRNA pseudouridine synthase [Synergistota bacterium]MCX8127506.1 rRNA pseudouridine synthase [Synergistota bacterium]MDW8191578.1 pseudouridine synthase [Synergistota bacterium]
MKIRLNKFLAQCGVTSRRRAEDLILSGRVSVNGRIVRELAFFVNPEKDEVRIGKRLLRPERKVYIVLNKPVGYVCAVKDKWYPTVMDLIKGVKERVYPVGRLDLRSEGLLVITNDGELTHFLTHPSGEIKKTYLVKGDRLPNEVEVKAMQMGVPLEDGITSPAKIKILPDGWVEISIGEGKKREVRRIFGYFGIKVERLIRVAIGKMRLKNLKEGEYRFLTKEKLLHMILYGGVI